MYTFTKVIHILGLVANLLSTESLCLKKVYYRTDFQYLFIKHNSIDVLIADVSVHYRLPYLSRLLEGLPIALNSLKVARKPTASIIV